MRRLEPGRAQDVKYHGRDDQRSEEQLKRRRESLRLTEEAVLTLRRDLDYSRKAVWETLANGVVNSYRTKLRKIEDARRALEKKFVEAVENLRLRSEELETSMVEVEVSRFKCLEFKFLAAALQEHVSELEEVCRRARGP